MFIVLPAMKSIPFTLVAGVAVASLGVSLFLLFTPAAPPVVTEPRPTPKNETTASLAREVEALRAQVAGLKPAAPLVAGTSGSPPREAAAMGTAAPGVAALEQRLRAIEAAVARLQSSMDGVSLEKASADREALFAAEEGYVKADEYFEAGKFTIAGEGYLTFVQHHPDHPDAREVMKKARNAFLKAGYADKAFWVQEEMRKRYPQNEGLDIWEQAQLEKDAGRYNDAVNHSAQAAELATNPEERLWRRLYWAYYVQLRDGNPAGITALRQVQQEIVAAGLGNHKLAAKAQEKLQEWQRMRR